MKNLKLSEKILILVLLISILGYVYNQYLFSPILHKLNTTQSNIEKYNIELNELKLLEAGNKKLQAYLDEMKVKMNESIGVLPKSERSPEVQRQIKDIADNTKVFLSSLTISTGAEYKQVSDPKAQNNGDNKNTSGSEAQEATEAPLSIKTMVLPITLSISGDYTSIMNFIKAFEENRRLSEVNAVSVTPKSAESGDGQLSASLTASIFYLNDGTEVKNEYDFNNGSYSKDNPYK